MTLTKNEKTGANTVELGFSIPAQEFAAAVDAVAKRESKKFNIPGFRKGKAPRHMIERMYGADVFYTDAINDVFPAAYEAAVKEAGIEPVDQPQVDVVECVPEKDLALKATVTVKPEVKVADYKGLKAEKEGNTVTDEAVDAEIGRMADRNSRMVTKEGAAEKGDTANINFEGFVDGTAFEGGKGESFDLLLGSSQFIPGFEDQVIGHAAGEEYDVNVTFPEEYQAENLAGKAAVFKCKTNEVKKKELPALDDEFAKDVSEFDTLADLKADIRKKLEEEAEKKANLALEDNLVNQVIGSMEADVPQCMIDNTVSDMVRDFSYKLEQQGLKLDAYLKYANSTMEQFRAGFAEQAAKQVKIRLALEKVAQLENIVPSEEDVEKEVKRIADAYHMEVEKVRTMLPMDEVKKDLSINKAIDFIRDNAKITDKK